MELEDHRDFSSEEEYAAYLKNTAITDIEAKSQELIEAISIVSNSMKVIQVNQTMGVSCGLSDKELQLLAMKIPAICAFLQAGLASVSLSTTIDETLIDIKVAQELNEMPKERGSGTASERTKRAELKYADRKLENVTMKQYIKSMQDLITRADKVYEGIKKTLDFRAREVWYDRKNTGA